MSASDLTGRIGVKYRPDSLEAELSRKVDELDAKHDETRRRLEAVERGKGDALPLSHGQCGGIGCAGCNWTGLKAEQPAAPTPGKRTLIEKLFMAIEERWAPGSYAVTLLKEEYVAMSTAPAPAGEPLVDELTKTLGHLLAVMSVEIREVDEREGFLKAQALHNRAMHYLNAARSQPAAGAEGSYDRETCLKLADGITIEKHKPVAKWIRSLAGQHFSGRRAPVTHSLERTSPKGEPFIGRCVLCGKTELTPKAALEQCPNPQGVSQDYALIDAIERGTPLPTGGSTP